MVSGQKHGDPDPPGTPPRLLLRRLDQVTIALLLAASLVGMAGTAWMRSRQHLIEIDQVGSLPLDFRVDINRADWPELALLPKVGETLARRIVECRQQQGAFAAHQDLLRVPGIGPRILEGLRPFLLPLPAAGDGAPPPGSPAQAEKEEPGSDLDM